MTTPHQFSLWLRAIRQLVLIMLASAVIALAVNHFRSSSLPLVENWSQEARLASPSGHQMIISLYDARKLYQSRKAVFLDARPSEEFLRGHIMGAVSLPWQDADQRVTDVIKDMPNDAMIVTYCDGTTCDLSRKLALLLETLGFTNVRVLVNGWTVWHGAGLPVATGKQ